MLLQEITRTKVPHVVMGEGDYLVIHWMGIRGKEGYERIPFAAQASIMKLILSWARHVGDNAYGDHFQDMIMSVIDLVRSAGHDNPEFKSIEKSLEDK